MRLIDADKLNTELFDADWMLDNDEHMVEEIVERQPTVEAEPVWISVEDRLPEPDVDVILIAKGWDERQVYIGRLHEAKPETSWLTGLTSAGSEWTIYGFSYLKERLSPTGCHCRNRRRRIIMNKPRLNPRCIHMLLKIKQACMEDNDLSMKMTGCGNISVARYIDDLIECTVKLETACEEYFVAWELENNENQAFYELLEGYSPDMLTEDERAEVKALVKKWKQADKEDEPS